MYTTLPYFLARVLVDLPMKCFGAFLFGSITYWTVGLQPHALNFFVSIITLVLLALAGNAMGLFLACLFSDVAIALMVAPMLILPLMMFSGFFLNPESVPVWLSWLEWISPMKYAFAALTQNEYTNLALYCQPDQLRKLVTPGGVVQVCPLESGEAVLDQLNIQPFLTITNCLLLLCLLAGVFTLLAYFALVLTSRRSLAKSTPQKASIAQEGEVKETSTLDKQTEMA